MDANAGFDLATHKQRRQTAEVLHTLHVHIGVEIIRA